MHSETLRYSPPPPSGSTGVVNRSQHDINMNKSVKAAREAEDAFFTSHPSYSGVLSRCSTATLAKASSQPPQTTPIQRAQLYRGKVFCLCGISSLKMKKRLVS